MKKFKIDLKKRSLRLGGYSVFTTVIVVAIAIMINVLAGALPTTLTKIDTSASELFSLSDQTKKIIAGVDDEVNIYWVVTKGSEDANLETILEYYEGLSKHINVVKKDPNVYPTFVQTYTDTVEDNSLIIISGDKYRYVSYEDIYEYDYTNYYYNGTYDVYFAGENAITSAVNYVVSEDTPKLYCLTGHGEGTLSTTLEDIIVKENFDVESLSLLTMEAVPEDADVILINAPQTDISETEKDMLLTYLANGGNLIYLSEPPMDTELTNMEAVMEYYGVTATEGIVVEGNSNYYYWGMPYYLLPEINSHDITDPLIDGGYYTLLPIAQGLVVGDVRDTVTVTELLTTSSSAFSKLDSYEMTTYNKEDGDIDGPFALAVAITETVDDVETNILWVTTSALIDDTVNSYVSGGNQDLFLNALNWMCDNEESISIRSKSLNYSDYLVMDSSTASALTIVVVGIIPVAYLIVGIVIWVRRKRR